ncbi:helix-turn-helix domain-containing protein [Thiorhodococcus minor]|uniref:Helix-turn-helix transcriptional regulator n=1 Tax=Thiorhodococcus minor TaxID=57489 RepID=A0A6M0JVG9_9GAMM|nr:helix-turn-helix transcriptional regulator [Thiorhodococcus minor]
MPAESTLHKLHCALKAARLRAGLTQAQMAKKMRLSQGYLSQIESGARVPSLRVLQLAAQTTGAKLSELLDAA